MQRNTITSLLFILPLVMVLFMACNREEVSPVGADQAPGIALLDHGDQDEEDPFENPCAGTEAFFANYSFHLMTPPGYDFGVQILNNAGYSPPEGCSCKEISYCVTFNFPSTTLLQVGTVQSGAPVSSVAPMQSYTPPTITSNGGSGSGNLAPPSGQGSPSNMRICVPPGTNQIFIHFANGVPPGFDPNTAVFKVIGICVIDNIPSPTG